MTQAQYKLFVGKRRDSHHEFSYSDRHLDALSSLFNITRSPCAAIIEGEKSGKYYLSYNVNSRSLANKSGANATSLKIIPSLIENLNHGNTDLLLAQYLLFTNNAREIIIAILKEESMRSPGESELYHKIHKIRDKCTDLKALLIKYKFSPIKIAFTREESFTKIAEIDKEILALKMTLKQAPKDERKSIGNKIALLRKEKDLLEKSYLKLSEIVSELVKGNNIKEAIEHIIADRLVMSEKEKDILIYKLESLINYEELLVEVAAQYKEIVSEIPITLENKERFADDTSALHHLLRPIQDTEKLTAYFKINGIKISDLEIIWPSHVDEGYTKHCEEILYEKFPDAKYIGISHLSCASCSELLPNGKHRGDSAVAFPSTLFFEELKKTEGAQEIRDEDGVIVNPMQRTMSVDEDLTSILGADLSEAFAIEVI